MEDSSIQKDPKAPKYLNIYLSCADQTKASYNVLTDDGKLMTTRIDNIFKSRERDGHQISDIDKGVTDLLSEKITSLRIKIEDKQQDLEYHQEVLTRPNLDTTRQREVVKRIKFLEPKIAAMEGKIKKYKQWQSFFQELTQPDLKPPKLDDFLF